MITTTIQLISYLAFLLIGVIVSFIVSIYVVRSLLSKGKIRDWISQLNYNPESVNFVKIGELSLSSQNFNTKELAELSIRLLKEKSIIDYLGLVNVKKQGNYFG